MEAEAENVRTGDNLSSRVLLYVRLLLVSLTMINASANSSNNDT